MQPLVLPCNCNRPTGGSLYNQLDISFTFPRLAFGIWLDMTVSLNANKGNRFFLAVLIFLFFCLKPRNFFWLPMRQDKKKRLKKCRGVAVLMFVWWRRATSGAWNHQPWNLFGHGSWIPLASRDYYKYVCVCLCVCTAHTSLYPGLASYSS